MRSLSNRVSLFTLVAGVIAMPLVVQARDKKVKPAAKDPQDAIEVVGHIASTSGPVTRFLATQHYSSYYLYAEHGTGNNVTLIDVTRTSRPAVLADVSYPSGGGSDSLVVVAGTAALVSEAQGSSTPSAVTQTFRIMDFSDPQHPKVAREFTGVTAMSRDERRGLIFVANSEGIWILHQSLAEDPEVEKEYAKHVLLDH
jgi:hypothetical protein